MPEFQLVRAPVCSEHYHIAAIMARQNLFPTLLFLYSLISLSWALKFDLAAHTGHSNKYERCIRNFVAKDTLVLVTAIVDGQKGDGQQVNMHVGAPNYILKRRE